MARYRYKIPLSERIANWAAGFGIGAVIFVWLIGVLASIALPIVIIWALVKLVMHFTADPVTTAMVGNALSYLS